ncbi:hypothetical protein [Longimicrobium sp.]|uniref:hypothetical protein n=1 Tax=Longimicrobium sp. TaxID=2029185 RepID=UPI002CBB8B48|nr:hypothetical protein [Longimicrobium sp.]HSU13139.1 hypothetical protein [Longimicrobium sp.]
MPEPAADLRIALLREALESYRSEYDLLVERWKGLETKAQGTVAIAGIFLAGIFTFIRDLKATSPALERWVLVLVALLLALTVALAVLALRVREIEDPVPGQEAERMVLDICSLSVEEIPERMPGLFGEQFGVWREVNLRVRASVERKARWLRCAQSFLMAASLLMCGMSVVLAIVLR